MKPREPLASAPWHSVAADAPLPPLDPFSDDEEDGEIRETDIPPTAYEHTTFAEIAASAPANPPPSRDPPTPTYVVGDSNFTDISFYSDPATIRPCAARGATFLDVPALVQRIACPETVRRIALGLGTNAVRDWGSSRERINSGLHKVASFLRATFPRATIYHLPVHVAALHGLRKTQGALVNELAARHFRTLPALPSRHPNLGIHFTPEERQIVLQRLQLVGRANTPQ